MLYYDVPGVCSPHQEPAAPAPAATAAAATAEPPQVSSTAVASPPRSAQAQALVDLLLTSFGPPPGLPWAEGLRDFRERSGSQLRAVRVGVVEGRVSPSPSHCP